MYLDTIYMKRCERITKLKEAMPTDVLIAILENQKQIKKPLSFKQALQQPGLSIIGEIKKASPSKGVLNEGLDPVQVARIYEQEGVCAISVLTEPDYFQGAYNYLEDVSHYTSLPLLNKDFIWDPWQICKAKQIGADAVLLIASMLSLQTLRTLYDLAHTFKMDVLLEVHNEADLEKALSIDADIIGVNNRDLQSFDVDLETTLKLSKLIPKDKVLVSESGIKDTKDLVLLKEAYVDAVLIGESFVVADSIEEKVRKFTQVARAGTQCGEVGKGYE